MRELYRKSAIEKLSSPDQLDKVIRITSPMSWLILFAVALIFVAIVVWSFTAVLPLTVTINGIVVPPDGVSAMYAQEMGIITQVHVQPGSELIKNETLVLSFTTPDGIEKEILAGHNGTVHDVTVQPGGTMHKYDELMRVTPQIYSRQAVVCYVPASDSYKLKENMRAHVKLNSDGYGDYGYMWARVSVIDECVSSTKGMRHVLGYDNHLIEMFAKEGAVVCMVLQPDLDEGTPSGYSWSNDRIAPDRVENGELCTARVIVREEKPIERLFGRRKI